MNASEQFVISLLTSMGIAAEKIPENGLSRTADVRAHDDTARYILEVKTRTDDETLANELRNNRFVFRTWPVGPTKAAAGIFQYALSQIDSTASDELRLIWICVESRRQGEYTLAEQLRHTLYGISRVAGTGRASTAPECYFFHDSVFFRYKHLDGAVISFKNMLVLCINPYSARVDDLRNSRLAKVFARNVLDPETMERAGSCLVADCDIDRRRPAEVLAYLSRKYGIERPVHFNFDEHAGFAAIRMDGKDEFDDFEA